MKILAFDTATASCSAALWKDKKIISYRYKTMVRGHAEHLLVMIREVLAEAGANFSNIDLLAVTNGPGGFTGLRVGLATARGISFAGDLSCIGISNLELVANGVTFTDRDDSYILAAIDSKREDIYIQIFANVSKGSELQSLGNPEALLPKDLAKFLRSELPLKNSSIKKIIVVGDATDKAIAALKNFGIETVSGNTTFATDARGVAEIAANRWKGNTCRDSLKPLYLRPPDATIPRNGGRLRP